VVTPNSFDIDTCKEIIGDAKMRVIEGKARQDADNGVIDPPTTGSKESYWVDVKSIMEGVVYVTAHKKRLERVARIKEREKNNA
jgi:hypothetical protein